jgi:hypothetical protein
VVKPSDQEADHLHPRGAEIKNLKITFASSWQNFAFIILVSPSSVLGMPVKLAAAF